jgi:hypothetical protein
MDLKCGTMKQDTLFKKPDLIFLSDFDQKNQKFDGESGKTTHVNATQILSLHLLFKN